MSLLRSIARTSSRRLNHAHLLRKQALTICGSGLSVRRSRNLCLRLFMLSTLLLVLQFWQFWQAGAVLGHGVGYAQLMDEKPVVLEFQYATGDPAAYAAIKIYAPADAATSTENFQDSPKVEYQNGRTDASGRFSFVPDSSGTWTVIMTDGQGHRSEAAIEYSLALTEPAMDKKAGATPQKTLVTGAVAGTAQSNLNSLPNWLKAIFGLSLLINILTFYYVIKSKQENKRRDHAH